MRHQGMRLLRMLLIAAAPGLPSAAPAFAESGTARKAPGLHKVQDVTPGRGIISRDAAIGQRRALAPLKERISTTGMRAAEADYAEALRKWAVAQDKRLLELQKIHSSYERLKAYRDRAAATGKDISRIDPRLEEMERKITALSDGARQACQTLEQMTQEAEAAGIVRSSVMKLRHDTAKNVLDIAR